MAVKKRSSTQSSGAIKKRNQKNQLRLKNRTTNLDKGVNPNTGKSFILLDSNWKVIGNYQTRLGALENKIPGQKMKIYEKGNLLPALNKVFKSKSNAVSIFESITNLLK